VLQLAVLFLRFLPIRARCRFAAVSSCDPAGSGSHVTFPFAWARVHPSSLPSVLPGASSCTFLDLARDSCALARSLRAASRDTSAPSDQWELPLGRIGFREPGKRPGLFSDGPKGTRKRRGRCGCDWRAWRGRGGTVGARRLPPATCTVQRRWASCARCGSVHAMHDEARTWRIPPWTVALLSSSPLPLDRPSTLDTGCAPHPPEKAPPIDSIPPVHRVFARDLDRIGIRYRSGGPWEDTHLVDPTTTAKKDTSASARSCAPRGTKATCEGWCWRSTGAWEGKEGHPDVRGGRNGSEGAGRGRENATDGRGAAESRGRGSMGQEAARRCEHVEESVNVEIR